MPWATLEAEHARLPTPTKPVDAALEATGLSTWNTHLTAISSKERVPSRRLDHTLPVEPLPHMVTHPDTFPFRARDIIPGRYMLYASKLSSTHSSEVKEALVDF